MHDKKTFAVAEVKSAQSDSPNGEFEIIMSTDAVDRDGESIIKGAFDPLPASVPVHAFHDFHDPVGRAVPSYNEKGQLVGRGFFASTPRAQEIRQLVADGVIGHTSVGFMAAERKSADDGVPEIESAELLEVSFVSVPSNRDAAVLMVKEADAQSRDAKATKGDRLQSIHDLAVQNGAMCVTKGAHPQVSTEAPASPAPEAGKPEEAPAFEAGKSPASNVVEMARIRADIARLSLTD